MENRVLVKMPNEILKIKGAEVEPISKMPRELEEAYKKSYYNRKVVNIFGQNKNVNITGTDQEEINNQDNIIRLFVLNTSDEEGILMNNDDRFDIFFKELKDDMREREARTREEINQREKRFEASLDKYHQENKEREQRIFSAIEKLENKISEANKEMNAKLEKTEKNIAESIKQLETIKTTNFWGQVAFLVGIAAIIVAFILG